MQLLEYIKQSSPKTLQEALDLIVEVRRDEVTYRETEQLIKELGFEFSSTKVNSYIFGMREIMRLKNKGVVKIGLADYSRLLRLFRSATDDRVFVRKGKSYEFLLSRIEEAIREKVILDAQVDSNDGTSYVYINSILEQYVPKEVPMSERQNAISRIKEFLDFYCISDCYDPETNKVSLTAVGVIRGFLDRERQNLTEHLSELFG